MQIWANLEASSSRLLGAAIHFSSLRRVSPKKDMSELPPAWPSASAPPPPPPRESTREPLSTAQPAPTCTSRVRASSSSWPKCWPSVLKVSLTQAFIDFRTCSFSTWRHLGKRNHGVGHWDAQVFSPEPLQGPDLGLPQACGWCKGPRETSSAPGESEMEYSRTGSSSGLLVFREVLAEMGATSSCHWEERLSESGQIHTSRFLPERTRHHCTRV